MQPDASTVSAEFFDRKYQAQADPWSFETDAYERARYAAVLGHVPAGRFRRAFEPGCSIGALTEQLGELCGEVVATDISATAVASAQARCRRHPHVAVTAGGLAPPSPTPFDLVVFSEVGYYLERDQLTNTIDALTSCLEPSGRLIAVHWTGRSADHVLHGSDVHDLLGIACADWLHPFHAEVEDRRRDGYLLDVWDRPGGTAC